MILKAKAKLTASRHHRYVWQVPLPAEAKEEPEKLKQEVAWANGNCIIDEFFLWRNCLWSRINHSSRPINEEYRPFSSFKFGRAEPSMKRTCESRRASSLKVLARHDVSVWLSIVFASPISLLVYHDEFAFLQPYCRCRRWRRSSRTSHQIWKVQYGRFCSFQASSSRLLGQWLEVHAILVCVYSFLCLCVAISFETEAVAE